jgi:hypothetical protein
MKIANREIRDVTVAMEESLATPTMAEATVMLPPTFQPFHHHQTSTVTNQAVHLDLHAVATREMDTVVAVAAELHLPHPLFLLSLNHLKALLALLNKWILPLATAAAETEASKVKTGETTIIVAKVVAAMMEEQVEETMAMAGIAVVLMMQGEVVDKEMQCKDNKIKVRVKDRDKDKVVLRGRGEAKVILVVMRGRGEDSDFSFSSQGRKKGKVGEKVEERRGEIFKCTTTFFLSTR